jgi:phosphoenolpyruvate carboxylase
MTERLTKDQPLRDDIHLLGTLLGETLQRQESMALFEQVEKVRNLAKSARAGDGGDFAEMTRFLRELPAGEALPIARAFAHFLNLANIAEQHHRVRRRREYARDPHAAPQPGSILAALSSLLSSVGREAVVDAIGRMSVELVFTAHPTEVARRTLLHKYDRIAELLARGDRDDLTVDERESIVEELRREVIAAWETDEVRHERPTPIDEVKSGLYIFERTLWNAVPAYFRTLDSAMRKTLELSLPLETVPIRFGSWIGGDRDGNPNVTAAVTEEACLLSRWVAAELYVRELALLRTELSMSEASEELRSIVGAEVREPYRALIKRLERRFIESTAAIEAMLPPNRWDPAAKLVSGEELLEGLMICHRSLLATNNGVIAEGRLLDLIRRARCFGTTLVKLDVRQDASRHASLIGALAKANERGDYESFDEVTRQQLLLEALAKPDSSWKLDVRLDDDDAETLRTFRSIATIPEESLGAYVITMASKPSDVLGVVLLQQLTGSAHPRRVVPLFETNADLEGASKTMDALFGMEEYRRRIDGRQEVMIGYSDSSKDAGRFAAAWALYKGQEEIVRVCRERGIELTLFHGRGGSVGRGGGPTYLAIESQPPGSVEGRLRVTVQGEMIQASFGLPDIALRSLEVYTAATLETTLTPAAQPREEWRAEMERLARVSREAYRRVVYETPEFIPFFRTVTPEPELGSLNIGSRPARRGGKGGGVESLRAIPWQFAWTQNRLLLASWLGVEAALESALAEQPALFRTMSSDWPFLRSTIDLIEMVLAKAEPVITRLYEEALVPAELRPIGEDLRRRLHLAGELLVEATGRRGLLETNPVLRRSIEVRNPYVDPINVVQTEILRRYREREDPALWDAFVVTVNGISAGMRNTG